MRGRQLVEAHGIATAQCEGADGFAETEVLDVGGDSAGVGVLVSVAVVSRGEGIAGMGRRVEVAYTMQNLGGESAV
jgi:hypothetical protein